MAYSLDVGLNLGAANTGLTLEAQLKDTAGVNVGAAITTGFVEFGATGNYLWHTAAMPDGHRGGIVFQVSPGGAIKTFVAINEQEVENPDVKTSTRSSHAAADVWAVGTRTLTGFGTLVADVATAVWAAGSRTLTGFGTLVADIWSHATRTLTSGAAPSTSDIATAVWSYVTRTLTQAIAAVSPPPVISGETVTVIKGDTWTLPFTDLGDVTGNTKLWLTVKADHDDDDDDALVQVERTVGLVRLNGAAATAGEGSATVDDASAGDVTFVVDEAATVEVPSGRYYYDVQSLISGTIRTHTSGRFIVAHHVTHAVS